MSEEARRMKALAEVFSIVDNYIHDAVHKQVHRQLSELRDTTEQHTEQLESIGNDLDAVSGKANDNTESLDSMEAHFQVFLGKMQAEMQNAVANIVNPEEDRMVKHEKRTHRLEEQMSELIRIFGEAGELD
tara:strand:- start:16 stop:408 length:393 start_codon:yes stop_codon:yes gene_type:complete